MGFDKEPVKLYPDQDMLDRLTRSIVAIMALFLIGQAILYSALAALCAGLPPSWAFYPISAAIHLAVTAFLIRLRADFVVEPEGRKLESVNLANVITLIRISTLPTLLALILGSIEGRSLIVVLTLSAAVFITDLLDGFVARSLKQRTLMGRMLDSISDYLVLAVLSIALTRFGLFHAWFFALLAFRLLFQALGMTAFFLARRPVPPRPTLAGKAAVASTMILCGLAVLGALLGEGFDTAFLVFEIITGAILALSVADKALVFIRHHRTTTAARPGPGQTQHRGD